MVQRIPEVDDYHDIQELQKEVAALNDRLRKLEPSRGAAEPQLPRTPAQQILDNDELLQRSLHCTYLNSMAQIIRQQPADAVVVLAQTAVLMSVAMEHLKDQLVAEKLQGVPAGPAFVQENPLPGYKEDRHCDCGEVLIEGKDVRYDEGFCNACV